jgi:predicted DsbA family dithiol-disulfide isomerase
VSLKPLAEEGIHIEWKAWKMPEDAVVPDKPEGYYAQAKEFLSNLTKQVGLEIKPPTTRYNTFLAHVGAKYANEKGLFDPYHVRIFEAVWKHDENIEDVEILEKIAEEVGLNPEEFKQALQEQTYVSQVEKDFQEAISQSIHTIPAYIGSSGEIQVHHFNDIPSISQLKDII